MTEVTTKFHENKFLFVPWLYISLKLLWFKFSSFSQQYTLNHLSIPGAYTYILTLGEKNGGGCLHVDVQLEIEDYIYQPHLSYIENF